jgi:hypothetical protein
VELVEGVGLREKKLGQTRPTSMTHRTSRVGGERETSASGYHPLVPPPLRKKRKKKKTKGKGKVRRQ